MGSKSQLQIIDMTVSDPEKLTRNYIHDAGMDITTNECFTLQPLERKLISTKTFILIPIGFVGYVMSRSGLAHKHGVVVLNAPGVIDSGYTGEIFVNLMNFGDSPVSFQTGDRIAQLVVQKVVYPRLLKGSVQSVITDRNDNGHGSSGI